MLIYSSRFRTNENFTPQDFFDNIVEWNQNGRYTINDIEKGSLSFISGDDDNYLEMINLKEKDIIAARMHTETDGGLWNTDLIFNSREHLLSVQVYRSFSDKTVNINSRAYFPSFIHQIIKKGFAGKSGGLDISDKALCISKREVIMNAIESYDDSCALPMVYISSKAQISADKLAKKLTGIAVVIYDNEDSIADKFPAPVYVFFPHKNMMPAEFGPYPLHREIQFVITDYFNNINHSELETWNGIQNASMDSSNSELLKKYKGISSDNTILTEMYAELEEKFSDEAKIREDLGRENSKLMAENARLLIELERLKSGDVPILVHGSEPDIYTDEQREIVMDILKDHLRKSLHQNTRRYDVILSVINANPVSGKPDEYREIIRNALDGYKNFDSSKITAALKKVGIEIISHTGHYKIALNGDHRYVCEAAATCSDFRGGKALISEINNTML